MNYRITFPYIRSLACIPSATVSQGFCVPRFIISIYIVGVIGLSWLSVCLSVALWHGRSQTHEPIFILNFIVSSLYLAIALFKKSNCDRYINIFRVDK